MSSELLLNIHENSFGTAKYSIFIFGDAGENVSLQNNNGYSDNVILNADGFASVVVPNTEDMSGTGINNQGITISSDSEISAYLSSRESASTDLSIIFDKESLGTKYLLASNDGTLFDGGQFSAQATEDNTTLTITFPNGDVITKILDDGESFKYSTKTGDPDTTFSGNVDLTGTIIESSSPVAVFSGHGCTNVGIGFCDHIIEQMPAVENLSTEYVVGESFSPSGLGNNLIRVVAGEDATDITIDGVVVATLDAGQFHEFTLSENAEIINSSKPTLVAQYLQGATTAGEGDPAMMFVPGKDAWLSSYRLATPVDADAFETNLLNIIIPTAALPTLQINGVDVDDTLFTPVDGSDLSVGNVPIDPGIVEIDASENFQTSIFGFDSFDSYLTFGAATFAGGVSNVPPVAVDDMGADFTTDEATTLLTPSILANDSDANADDTISIVEINGASANFDMDINLPSGAILNVGEDGELGYVPNGAFDTLEAGETATDSFTYTISDGEEIDTATVTFTINGISEDDTTPPPVDGAINGTEGDDVLKGDNNPNEINGFGGDDVIIGRHAEDTINGGDGDDFIAGQASGDILTGGEGNDVFIYRLEKDSRESTGVDKITDFTQGEDKIDLAALGVSSLSMLDIESDGTDTIIMFGQFKLCLSGDYTLTDDDFIFGMSDAINGTDGNDILKGDNEPNEMNGFGGDDVIIGRLGEDTIDGGDGDDLIAGQASGDILTGGAGMDVFAYSNIKDSRESTGVDKITDFMQGEDKIDLSALGVTSLSDLTVQTDGSETNIIFGDFKLCLNGDFEMTEDDFIFGDAPFLALNGTNGNDTLKGGNDAELISGFEGDDQLYGRNGSDTLLGGEGNDLLAGQNGEDVLVGGLGMDTLIGGAKADIFKYMSTAESQLSTNMVDLISDFEIGTDTVDVSMIGIMMLTTDAVSGADALRLEYDAVENVTLAISDGADFAVKFSGDVSGTLSDSDFAFAA